MNESLKYQAKIIKELLVIESSTQDVNIIKSLNSIADMLINIYSDTDNYLIIDFQDFIYGRLEELNDNDKNSEWTSSAKKRLATELDEANLSQ